MNALAISGYPFVIGYQGENLVRTVRFRISEWKKEFPSGTATLLHKRSEDTDAYPVAVSVVGDYAEWTVGTSDVQYVGNGYAQLLWSVGNKVVKSEVFTTITLASLDQDENPPEAWQAWVDQVASSVSHYPKIDTATKHWLVWANGDWQDTGVTAEGSDASVTRESIEDALGVSSPNLSTNDYTTAEKTKLAGINLAAYRTSAEQDAIDSTKADSDDVYGRTYLDSKFAEKADADAVYDKTEVDEALADKADDDDVIKGVKVAGTELTKGADGKVDVPIGGANFGVAKYSNTYGIGSFNGQVFVSKAGNNDIDSRLSIYYPIVPNNLDYAVKAAMCDGVGAAWTESEKAAARSRIGTDGSNVDTITVTLEEEASKIEVNVGKAYKVMFAELMIPQGTTAISRSCPFYTYVSKADGSNEKGIYVFGSYNTTTSYDSYFLYMLSNIGGVWMSQLKSAFNSRYYNTNSWATSLPNYDTVESRLVKDKPLVKRVSIGYVTNPFSVGTSLTIYGIL